MRLFLSSILAALVIASTACGDGGGGSGGSSGSTSTAGTAGSGNAAGTSNAGTGGTSNAGTGGTSNAGTGGTGNTTGGSSGSATTGSGGTGDGTCHEQTDCTQGEFCAVYTLPPLCGGMEDTGFNDNCATDADCAGMGANEICATTICVFPHGGAQTPPHCRPGCTNNADCGPGLACNGMHHCEPASCNTPAQCGDNFACDAGKCAAKPCTTDADCGDFCVMKSCSATIGKCQPAVP